MEEVFRKYSGGDVLNGTDKGTTHSYLAAYEEVFSPRRADKIRLFEIGVFTGASLLAWADYFTHPETEIIGVDINPHLVRFPLTNPKVKTHVCNATVPADLAKIDGTFDFVIDDGSHELAHQMASFYLLKERVNPGGAYIIEDIQGPQELEVLAKFVETSGLEYKVYDTRHVKGRYDDLMLVIKV
jgi:cephalosporin hydroxylase